MEELYKNYENKLKEVYRALFAMYGIYASREHYSKCYRTVEDWDKVFELLNSLIKILGEAKEEHVDLGLMPIFHYTMDAMDYYNLGSKGFTSRKKKIMLAFNHLTDLYSTFSPKEQKNEVADNIDELIKSAEIFKLSSVVGAHFYGVYNGVYSYEKYSSAAELLFDLKFFSSTSRINIGDCIIILIKKVASIPNIRQTKDGKKLVESLWALMGNMVEASHRYETHASVKYNLLQMAEVLSGEVKSPKPLSPTDETIKSMHLFTIKTFEVFYRTGLVAKEYCVGEHNIQSAMILAGRNPIMKAFSHVLYGKLSECPALKDTEILKELERYCSNNKVKEEKQKQAEAMFLMLEISDELRMLASESQNIPKRRDLETLLKFKDILNRLINIIKMFDYNDTNLPKNCDFNFIMFYITEYLNYLSSKDKTSASIRSQDFESMQIPSLKGLLGFLREDLPAINYKTSGQLIYDISRLSKKSNPELRNYIAIVCQQILALTGNAGLPSEDLPTGTLRMVVSYNLFNSENNIGYALRLLQAERKVDTYFKK